jgi:hypothetical protein
MQPEIKEKNQQDIKLAENNAFLEPDDHEIPIVSSKTVESTSKKAIILKTVKTVLRISIIMLIISGLLFGFGLIWQGEVTLLSIGDALWLVFAIEFSIAWMMFVYNRNIISPLLHGTKTFLLMFVGKRPKKDYYTYMKSIEESPIPSRYYIIFFVSAFIVSIPAIIIMIILI